MKYLLIWISFLLMGQFLLAQPTELKLIDQWDDPSLPGSSIYDNTYNEVWGYAADGREYAIIGSTMGTHIFDVTEADELVELIFIPGASQGTHIIHRDYHDYKGYLYAVADESSQNQASTLQIIDLTKLPAEAPVVYDSKELLERSHNIYIDTLSAKLYALSAKGGATGYKGMKVFSLEDPLNPIEIGSYNSISGESFSHVHDAFVQQDTAFLNCGGDGLFIVDFSTDPPTLLSRFTSNDYPEAGYNHSGWPSEDMAYYYFADETHGSDMKVVELNGFNDIEIGNTFYAGDADKSIPHNQLVSGNILYSSYYYDGIQLFDLTDPASPELVAYYGTSQIPLSNQSYEGAWGVYPYLPSGNIIVSDMQNGLFLFECFGSNCNTVGTNAPDITNVEIKMFPNPAGNEVEISSSSKMDAVDFLDIQGRVIQSVTCKGEDRVRVDLHLINSGTYVVRIRTDVGVEHRKLMIVR